MIRDIVEAIHNSSDRLDVKCLVVKWLLGPSTYISRGWLPRILDHPLIFIPTGVITIVPASSLSSTLAPEHEALRDIPPGAYCLEAVLPMSSQSTSSPDPAAIPQPLPIDSGSSPTSFEDQSATSRQSREGAGACKIQALNHDLSGWYRRLRSCDVRSDQARSVWTGAGHAIG